MPQLRLACQAGALSAASFSLMFPILKAVLTKEKLVPPKRVCVGFLMAGVVGDVFLCLGSILQTFFRVSWDIDHASFYFCRLWRSGGCW